MIDAQILIISAASLGSLGVASAALLAGASKVFHVEQDPRVDALVAILPGANCGGCGFPGCGGFAQALVEGKGDLTACSPGGSDVAKQIGAVLGQEVADRVRAVVRLRCSGRLQAAPARVEYRGVDSCRALLLLAPGGGKACPRGCEGLGDCVRVCLFDAIRMGEDGLPVIDEEKCTACGQCVTACPKGLIAIEPYDATVFVACSTDLKPKDARKACQTACLACRLCVRTCPYDALAWDGRRPARIDDKCVGCGLCIEACKQGVLIHARGALPDPQVRAEAEQLLAARKAAEEAKKAAAKAAAAAKVDAAPPASADGGPAPA